MIRNDPEWRRIQFNKVLWITGIWVVVALIEFAYNYSILYEKQCLPENVQIGLWIIAALTTAMIAGVVGGTVTVTYFENWFRTHSYFKALTLVIVTFTAVFFVISGIAYSFLYLNEAGDMHVFVNKIFSRVFSVNFFRNYMFWLCVVFLTTIGLLVNDKYGPGVLREFLLGRYFKPRLEKRIFMFLDLRGSTSLAEKLGQQAYFNMLKEIFEDVTQPILYTRGEVYQYVGDEIVVSWPFEKGKAQANCIRCFFEIKEVLQRKSPQYLKKYGVAPEMKAGLHYGEVLAGEIGVIKRDITYTGDVLNTASRIQNQCNALGVDILLSQNLYETLKLAPNQYHPERLGSIDLRGKSEQMVLYTL